MRIIVIGLIAMLCACNGRSGLEVASNQVPSSQPAIGDNQTGLVNALARLDAALTATTAVTAEQSKRLNDIEQTAKLAVTKIDQSQSDKVVNRGLVVAVIVALACPSVFSAIKRRQRAPPATV